MKYEKQKEYCQRNNFKILTPLVKCYNCSCEIWEYISIYEASNIYIESCPVCGYTYE